MLHISRSVSSAWTHLWCCFHRSSLSLSKVIAEKLLVTFHDLEWPRRRLVNNSTLIESIHMNRMNTLTHCDWIGWMIFGQRLSRDWIDCTWSLRWWNQQLIFSRSLNRLNNSITTNLLQKSFAWCLSTKLSWSNKWLANWKRYHKVLVTAVSSYSPITVQLYLHTTCTTSPVARS